MMLNRNNRKEMTDIDNLVEAERPRLVRYACYRLGDWADAEDAVQDVFLQLHGKIRDADGCVVDNLRGYLYRSLANLCTDRLRQMQQRHFVRLEQACNEVDDKGKSWEEEFLLLSTLLDAIPEEQSEVIRLRLHGDYSFSDIADMLGVPLSTVKSRFQYGIEKIRKGIHQ